MNTYFFSFTAAFLISFVVSFLVIRFAERFQIVDAPFKKERKIHNKTTPLLGGVAVFVAFAIMLASLLIFSDLLTGGEITKTHYLGVFIGGLILIIGGYFDDRYELTPKWSVLAPVLAALSAIFFGIEIDKLTNPLGGFIFLEPWMSDLLVFVWLMVVMYTTKFLDGLDGLATGVSSIGVLMILLLSLTVAYFQPDVALLASLSLGALIGFLVWNFSPAAIFLGEGGSTFVGYLLGILAVISGGKVATALLVLGIPLLDVIWVVLRRFANGGLSSTIRGDRKHLHHRLLDLGWGQRRIVLLYYFVAAGFGISTLFLQSKQKLVALIILALMMIIAAAFLVIKEKQTKV